MGVCRQRFLEQAFFLLAHLPPKEFFNLFNIILHVISIFTLDTSCREKVIEKERGQPCDCPLNYLLSFLKFLYQLVCLIIYRRIWIICFEFLQNGDGLVYLIILYVGQS